MCPPVPYLEYTHITVTNSYNITTYAEIQCVGGYALTNGHRSAVVHCKDSQWLIDSSLLCIRK